METQAGKRPAVAVPARDRRRAGFLRPRPHETGELYRARLPFRRPDDRRLPGQADHGTIPREGAVLLLGAAPGAGPRAAGRFLVVVRKPGSLGPVPLADGLYVRVSPWHCAGCPIWSQTALRRPLD